jgi:repressor LexA
MLSASPGRARSLRLTSGARRLLERVRSGGSTFRQVAAGAIPLVGVVAAGLPTEAVENTEHLSFAGCFGGGGGDIFALEVRGDSMIGRDIREGDYVVCRRSAAAENGQLVVAILDEEEATLKRFYRDRAHARLEPANDDYETVYSDNCRIEGVVVGLIRRL